MVLLKMRQVVLLALQIQGFNRYTRFQLEILELFNCTQILKLRLNLGFGLGLSRKVYRDEVGVNYNFAEFKYDQAKDPSFEVLTHLSTR
jgi:hypothetical protein